MAARKSLIPLYLVDASIYIFRAYFSLPESICNSSNKPANAVYGFASFLSGLLSEKNPGYIVAMFDGSLTTCFRNQLYPRYKASRALPDPDLARQLNWCRELTELVGIKTYASKRYEADDLIGTTAARMREHGFKMIYVTGDKDLGQLIHGQDRVWDYARDEIYGRQDILRRFGIKPDQFADYQGLAGDAVDDIPGVPGIGAKTASRLISRFGDLATLYKRVETGRLTSTSNLQLRGLPRIESLLNQHKDMAWLSRELATISTTANIRPTPASLRRKPVKTRSLNNWLHRNGFGNRLASRLPQS